eukprot:COSAG02_NODE_20815_length_814_cov_24.256298_1_plen_89_part_00
MRDSRAARCTHIFESTRKHSVFSSGNGVLTTQRVQEYECQNPQFITDDTMEMAMGRAMEMGRAPLLLLPLLLVLVLVLLPQEEESAAY